MEPRHEIVRISPDTARKMLTRNLGNRKVRKDNLTKLTTAMSAGEFKFTGESIKFGESGTLLDGQHRLMAIIKSGVPLKMLVIWNVPDESWDVLDRGVSRSNGDMLAHHNIKNPNIVAAIAGLVVACRKGVAPDGGRRSYQTLPHVINQEVLERSCLYDDAALLGKRARANKLNPSAVGALYILAIEKGHEESVREFFKGLITGANLSVGDVRLAAIRLIHNNDGLRVNYMQLATLIRCFNQWRLGINRHHVKSWQPGQEYPEIIE